MAKPGSGGGNFRLLVSDEPNDIGDFYSVNVTISKIGVQADGSDGWTDYEINPPRTVDLTKLIGDNASEVWNGTIASGNYTKVFIYVDNVTGILKGSLPGDNTTVKLPGDRLQISKPFSVSQEEGSSIVSFVFDITIIKAGNSGKYILKPQVADSGADKSFKDVTSSSEQEHGKGSGKDNSQKPGGVAPGPDGDQPGKGRQDQ